MPKMDLYKQAKKWQKRVRFVTSGFEPSIFNLQLSMSKISHYGLKHIKNVFLKSESDGGENILQGRGSIASLTNIKKEIMKAFVIL